MKKLPILVIVSIIIACLSFNYCFAQRMVQILPIVGQVVSISESAIVIKMQGTSKDETYQIAKGATIEDSADKRINISDIKPGDKVGLLVDPNQKIAASIRKHK